MVGRCWVLGCFRLGCCLGSERLVGLETWVAATPLQNTPTTDSTLAHFVALPKEISMQYFLLQQPRSMLVARIGPQQCCHFPNCPESGPFQPRQGLLIAPDSPLKSLASTEALSKYHNSSGYQSK
ncbi:hypothetical protein VTI74DRAFT_6618 [Chaetomium olivicolor]